ncbi:MAG: hypothetical protein Terrestrivirus2_171 [Terrestrivirus sp.]|uniref:RING-type domain-containing protein n=1 Tax=Terrestrivirus sp. TaxID=2487775 RepID=A0A3G4ZPX7_9VIRU|nr:MAG: hypothetical protein Terrestrivirus2_171 [Terrestrivirus sp.]
MDGQIVLYKPTTLPEEINLPEIPDAWEDILLETKSSIQVPLSSKRDIDIEVLLTYRCGVVAEQKYNSDKEQECEICLEPMKDTYVLKYPCRSKAPYDDKQHVFHRNCILTQILMESKKGVLFNNADRCPSCSTMLPRQKI